jgi:hypothetical protein
VLSHHKCAGVRNWGRAAETLGLIDAARQTQPIHLDCYPYTAGSTVIRPDLADGEIEILINWSTPHPEMAGRTLKSNRRRMGDNPDGCCRAADALAATACRVQSPAPPCISTGQGLRLCKLAQRRVPLIHGKRCDPRHNGSALG